MTRGPGRLTGPKRDLWLAWYVTVAFYGLYSVIFFGLSFDGDVIPPPGTHLQDADGKDVGDIRSAARSPRLGGVALGMVRHEAVTGAVLIAQWSAGSVPVVVQGLPFPL